MNACLSDLQKNLLMLALEYRDLHPDFDICMADAVHRIYDYKPKRLCYMDPDHPTRFAQDHHYKGRPSDGQQFGRAANKAKSAISRSITRLCNAGLMERVYFEFTYQRPPVIRYRLTYNGLSMAQRLTFDHQGDNVNREVAA